jgi:hypothetical protein
MNSAALVSQGKAKESLKQLDSLSTELKAVRAKQLNAITAIEPRMTELNISEDLVHLKEAADINYQDAATRIRDATKRWNTVKSQSSTRPVAEYSEEVVTSPNLLTNPINAMGAPDPTKMLSDTGKSISNIGKTIGKQPGTLFRGGAKAVVAAAKFASHAVDGAVDVAVTGAKNTTGAALEAIGLEDNVTGTKATPAKPAKPTSSSISKSGSGLSLPALPNIFDLN